MSPSTQEASKEVRIDELQPGMILDEPVSDPDSSDELLSAGTRITEKEIKALKRREIYRVTVEEQSYEERADDSIAEGVDFSQDELEELAEDVLDEHKEDERKKQEESKEFYTDCIRFTRSLFDDVGKNRNIGVDDLKERVNSMLTTLVDQQEEVLKMTRTRNDDEYLISHTVNMTFLAIYLGRQLEFSRNEIIELGIGCLLHDVGMTKIPAKLLNKQGPLSDKEYKVIQQHPLYKKDYLEDLNGLSFLARSVVLQHHERIDGSGYPNGLEGGGITKLARVAGVVDAYEAMVSPRVYRDRKTSYEAMQIIIRDAGTKFWEKASRYFYQNMASYPIGSVVELNSGAIGVVHQPTPAPLRPKVKVLVDESGEQNEYPPVLNLLENRDNFIESVLDEIDI